jgi:hypothetical protein
MVGTMRGIWLGAMLAAAALLIAGTPAQARPIEYTGEITPTGALTISWHGDPARGCAQAGLCGYRGSIDAHPDSGSFDIAVKGRRVFESFGFLDLFESPIVRVKREESGGADAECVDSSPDDSIEVNATNAGADRTRLGLASEELSSGRCAGPRMSALLARLPRHTRSLGHLIRKGGLVDFSGEVPFKAGRFSGTLRSTLRLRFSPASRNVLVTIPPRPTRPPHRRRLVRVVHLSATYRVSSFTGSLATSFGALADPPCEDRDSCGLAGTATWALSATHGTLRIDADARARRSDHGIRGALAAVRRRGAYVFGDADLSRNLGTTTVDLSRPNGVSCHDTASAAPPGLAAYNSSARRFTFELGGEDSYPTSVDLIRTGCPGPRDSDALGSRPLASGSVPLTRLGRHAFTVDLHDAWDFSSNGYSGRNSSRFRLDLRRISLDASYRRARGIG